MEIRRHQNTRESEKKDPGEGQRGGCISRNELNARNGERAICLCLCCFVSHAFLATNRDTPQCL